MPLQKYLSITTAACVLAASNAQAGAASNNSAQWTKAKPVPEAALSCNHVDHQFPLAGQALQGAGWNPSQGTTPVDLPVPLPVFGLKTQRIAVARDGGEQTYRALLPGVSIAQVVKAAKLKLGKDGKEYGLMPVAALECPNQLEERPWTIIFSNRWKSISPVTSGMITMRSVRCQHMNWCCAR